MKFWTLQWKFTNTRALVPNRKGDARLMFGFSSEKYMKMKELSRRKRVPWPFVMNIHTAKNYYKYNHRREGVRVANARPKVIIFCKSRPSNWQLKRIWLQEWLNIGTIENRNNAQVGQVIHFEFRFQTVHMHFGIIYQLQCHENIENNKLICLKILVCAVWIPVWEPTKYLRIWWIRSVWKN